MLRFFLSYQTRARRRRIFRLKTSAGVKWIDPLPAARAMEATLGPDWTLLAAKLFQPPTPLPPGMPAGSLTAVLEAERAAGSEAARRLADAAIVALGVPPLTADGKGATEDERLNAVVEFVGFLAELAEDARPFGTSPSPMA